MKADSKHRTAALHSLGCRVNSYETQAMEESLVNAGYEIVPFDRTADVYVINTCSVTAVSDKKSRQMIRRARRLSRDAVVVACGCFVQKDVDTAELGCDIVLGNNHKGELVKSIDQFIKDREDKRLISNLHSPDTVYENTFLLSPQERTRGFIKVQDGCNSYCSYCIIPYVRGRSRSRSLADIRAEAESFAKKGCKEVVLSGINLSDYHYEGMGLGNIIETISEIEGIERIRLGSLEPDVFSPEFVETLVKSQKVCPHFHFSLQSGCDKTLSEMNRRYTFGSYEKAVMLLRRSFDNPAICADVIAGFPGESEEDHRESFENIRRVGFYELHVFPYSKREGTKAARAAGQLTKAVKEERAADYIRLSERMSEEYKRSLAGRSVSVLFEEFEEIDGERYLCGFTGEYVRGLAPAGQDLRGQVAECVVESPGEPGKPVFLNFKV